MPSEYDIDTLVREFLTESEEHFETLDADLLLLERALDDPSCLTPETIEEMFRATHTLKGLSSMFDFVHVKELAHAIESIFDDLRKERRVLDAPTVELLFDAVDALRRAVSRATQEDQCIDETEEMTATVRDFTASGAADTGDSGCAVPEADALGEYAKTRLVQAAEEGKRGVSLRLRWGLELRLGAFRRDWLEEALGDGEVLEVRPAADSLPPLGELELEGADVEFEIVALTDVSNEEIAASLGLALERVAEFAGEAQSATQASRARANASECSSSRNRILRVDIARLDDLMDLAGELVTSRTRLEDITERLAERDGKDELASALGTTVREMAGMVNELQERVMQMRMIPVGQLFSKFPRAVRDIAKTTGKRIDLVLEGEDTELDKRVIEQIEDPLLHMLRNACDHGIETPGAREAAGKPACGTVILSAAHEGGAIIIDVRDDGAGLDLDAIRAKAAELDISLDEEAVDDDIAALIMQPGFSTATEVTDVSGRGVGLDVVARQVADLGGRVEVHTEQGQGTLFRLRLPLTLAIIPALIVDCCSKRFAVPLAAVVEVLRVDAEELTSVGGSAVLDLRGQSLPLAEVKDLLNLRRNGTPEGSRRLVVEVSGMGRRLGLLVDALAGQQEIVVKSIEEAMGHVPGVGGATILGDGSIVPILDVDMLVRLASKGRSGLSTPAVGR
jgi:two-component system chemotaxis sensor kinase CheA